MTTRIDHHSVDEHDLQAFIDDELTESRRARVERYLADHPADAHRIDAYRQQAARLRRSLVVEPYDSRLDDFAELEARLARRLRFGRYLHDVRVAAAAVAIIVAGWTLYHYAFDVSLPGFVNRAAAAYNVFASDPVHPVEVKAVESSHLIQWLSDRVGTRINIPDMHRQGYHLVGGRLVPNDDVPAGLLMYEDNENHRFSLFVTRLPSHAAEQTHFGAHGKVYVAYWARDGIGYVVSATDRAELIRLATAVHHEIPPVPFAK